MSRFNPDHEVEPIYHAAQQWRKISLIKECSVFYDSNFLWTSEILTELNQHYANGTDVGEGNFLDKLETQLSDGSPECSALMSECLWLTYLFQWKANVGESRKRSNVAKVWSWSGTDLDESHPLLDNSVLVGIGSAGTAFNTARWRELVFLINALRDFRRRDPTASNSIASDPWDFSNWLNSIPGSKNRQLTHILPHLLFPDQFERMSSWKDKCRILAAFENVSKREVEKWEFAKIDRTLLDLRKRLEKEHGTEIDFYQKQFREKWNPEVKKPDPRASKSLSVMQKTQDVSQPKSDAPLNLILYGPPGTGKTHQLLMEHEPKYQDENGSRSKFVTFHQSYSYEDFIEGIRPVTKGNDITYEIQSGVMKRLCDKARNNPDKRYALFIDEINRGNIAKVFGELISLIEVDKRIRTDSSGNRLSNCHGMEVTLPYSGDKFGVPANIDLIGTMNSADRSISLLDSALRRRFTFEELVPNYSLLDSIDDGEGRTIDLQQLLEALNLRITLLLHRDQTLGHSYFISVKSFDDLRQVFANQILPFLQDVFYDDRQKIQYVLADQTVEADFQLFRSKKLIADELFPGTEPNDIPSGETFEIIKESEITPDSIRKIYELPE